MISLIIIIIQLSSTPPPYKQAVYRHENCIGLYGVAWIRHHHPLFFFTKSSIPTTKTVFTTTLSTTRGIWNWRRFISSKSRFGQTQNKKKIEGRYSKSKVSEEVFSLFLLLGFFFKNHDDCNRRPQPPSQFSIFKLFFIKPNKITTDSMTLIPIIPHDTTPDKPVI